MIHTICLFFFITTLGFHSLLLYCSLLYSEEMFLTFGRISLSVPCHRLDQTTRHVFTRTNEHNSTKRTKYNKVLNVATAMEQTTVTQLTGICYFLYTFSIVMSKDSPTANMRKNVFPVIIDGSFLSLLTVHSE